MRKSPVYYIAPSTISITPNANGSFNDLAVYVANGCKVKVYSPKAGIGYVGGAAQEWEVTGRNRRLAESDKPYTIYVRLPKRSMKSGYLVFAAKEYAGGQWHDAYPYITTDGETAANASGNWYVRLGDVSLPENGLRTVTYDTGILGTEEFNTEWALNPDALPLRVELGCTIGDEDAGPTPYVFWGKTAVLSASLSEGWTGTVSARFDHWEITRDTGVAAADAQWNAVDRSATFGATGVIGLQHSRQAGDDFNGAVSTTFTVKAVGRADDGTDALVVLASESIVLLAETLEKYEIVLSTSFVSWNPMSDTYSPADGVRVNIRATDQRGDVVKITKGQMDTAGLTVAYQHAGSQSWTVLPFTNPSASVAEAVIPVAAFKAQLNVNVRILSQSGMEMHFVTIAFLRDGEDSRDREWIYLRSEQAITFGNAESEHPSPSLIPYGEVEPGNHAAGHVTDNKDQDGWVPEGWWDEMQGTDDTWHYEYAAYRDHIREDVTEGTPAHWGDFSKPVPWSYSAEDAVSYRCRWTLDGTEVWQLTASYTGAFQGTLPLVGTLMKRKGSDAEQAVTATSTVITIRCEGLTDTFVITSSNPQFTISPTENPEIIDKLNDKRLTGLSVTFAVDGGESFSYTIPVIREADEDSILRTMEERGGELFLSKRNDDTAGGFITFLKGLLSEGPATFRGLLTAVEAVITSIKSPNYTGDGIADTGFRLTADDGTGSSALTVDNLHVRKRAVFEELEVKKEMAVAGNEVKSCAANVIDRTDYYGDGNELLGYSERQVPWLLGKMPVMLRGLYARSKFFGRMRRIRVELDAEAAGRIKKVRCYFLANDGDREVRNLWRVGDLVRCQTINLVSSKRYIYINGGGQTATGNVYWWRKAVKAADTQGYSTVTIDGKEYHYFDVYCDYAQEQLGNYVNADTGSMIPCAGDHAVQFGNDHDPDRMNIIITEVNGADAPACKDYEGIYTFDLNKNWWQQGQQGESPLVYRRSPRAGVRIVSSKFELITRTSVAPVPVERGAWVSGFIYYYYDLVQHNGASWLCVASDGNRYQVVENITQPGSPDIPEGTVLTQAQYDTLSVENKIKCTRSATGSTDLEPSEQNVSVWRPYAQKGSTGQSAFKSTMFCRMTATPAKPTHGSYDNPSPADSAGTDTDGAQVSWYDGIPDGVKQLWASTRIFTSDGQAPQQSVWNDPRKMTDTETYDVEFAKKQPNDAKPANPNGHNQHGGNQTQVWFDPTLDSSEDFTQMYWRAERSIINGVSGSWVVVRIKGEKGDQGQSSFTSHVFKRQNSQPGTPTGGSYSSPVPSEWSDGVPDGTAMVWMSTRIFSSDGKAPQQSGWTTPRQMTDTADFDVEFSSVASNPGNPTDNPSNWSNTSSSSTIWMATRECHNGVWSAWQIAKIKGEKGDKMTFDDLTPQEKESLKGENGKDGWMITADPANVIITQNLATVSTFSSATVGFTAKKGNVSASIASIETPSSSTFNVSASGNSVVVSSPKTHGSPAEYYTEGSFTVTVNVTDPDTGSAVSFNVTVLCYANLLGTWKESVDAGVKEVVADEVDYDFLDGKLTKNNKSYTQIASAAQSAETWHSQMTAPGGWIEQTNTHISNAETNISKIQKTIGKNLLDCADGAGWRLFETNEFANYDKSIQKIYGSSTDNDFYSTAVYLRGGVTYVFSVYFSTNYTPSICPCDCGADPEKHAQDASITTPTVNVDTSDRYRGNYRYYITFTPAQDAYYKIEVYMATEIFRPQLEVGSTPTSWEQSAENYSSQIKQTADEIDASVRNDLNERVGIDIRGNNRSVNIQADSVNINRSTIGGTPTMTLQSSDSAQKIVFETTPVTDPMTGQSMSGYREWYGYAATTTLGGVSGDFLSLGARVKSDGSGEGRLVLDEAYVSNGEPKVRYEADMEGDYLRFRHANDTGSIDGTIEIGLDGANAYLKASNWPSHNSNMSSGRVYIDANGYLRVKGNASYLPEGAIPTNASILRRVGSSTTLDGTYETIICTTNNITLTLPSNPVNGQKYTIIPNNGITLRCGNSQHDIKDPAGDIMTSKWLEGPKFHFLIFDATDKRWYLDWGS